jgi:dynein heavy chain
MLHVQLPDLFDMKELHESLESRSDPEPMKTVLLQEVERYNKLVHVLRRTLTGRHLCVVGYTVHPIPASTAIQKAVQGLEAVTAELEEVIAGLLSFAVPNSWSFAYPSSKPLGSWVRDLLQRLNQISEWCEVGMPNVFWLPGFTYPTGFLTAILQTSARRNGVAIDQLGWEFPLLNHNDKGSISVPPKEGVYVCGLFLEGACWNFETGCLEEPKPMELIALMPIVHFKPVEGKKKSLKGFYTCPIYMYPVRTGTRERPSFVVATEIRAGKVSPDVWTKRGVAVVLSTAL